MHTYLKKIYYYYYFNNLLVHLYSPLFSDAGVTVIEPCSDAESLSASSLNDYIPCSNKEGSLLADIWHTHGENSQFLHFLKCTIVTSSQKVYKSWIPIRKCRLHCMHKDLATNIVHIEEDLLSVWTLRKNIQWNIIKINYSWNKTTTQNLKKKKKIIKCRH